MGTVGERNDGGSKHTAKDAHECVAPIGEIAPPNVQQAHAPTDPPRKDCAPPEARATLARHGYDNDERILAEWELRDFPPGLYDETAPPLDLSRVNSWSRRLGEVPTVELLQTLAANAAAPFVICGKLRPLLSPDKSDKDAPWGRIVNVTAMEGQFSVGRK